MSEVYDLYQLRQMADPNDVSWVAVKKHEISEEASFEHRFNTLADHHVKETLFLIRIIRNLSNQIIKMRVKDHV